MQGFTMQGRCTTAVLILIMHASVLHLQKCSYSRTSAIRTSQWRRKLVLSRGAGRRYAKPRGIWHAPQENMGFLHCSRLNFMQIQRCIHVNIYQHIHTLLSTALSATYYSLPSRGAQPPSFFSRGARALSPPWFLRPCLKQPAAYFIWLACRLLCTVCTLIDAYYQQPLLVSYSDPPTKRERVWRHLSNFLVVLSQQSCDI